MDRGAACSRVRLAPLFFEVSSQTSAPDGPALFSSSMEKYLLPRLLEGVTFLDSRMILSKIGGGNERGQWLNLPAFYDIIVLSGEAESCTGR